MAKSTAMTTALVAVASASSVATSPNTAADNIQAQSSHAVAYAAAAVQATPVSEVEPAGLDLPLHGILPRTSLTAQLAIKAAAQLQRALEADVQAACKACKLQRVWMHRRIWPAVGSAMGSAAGSAAQDRCQL
ncbi:hypothetical protein WJX82_010291 [Trebouxia sp. C0006]